MNIVESFDRWADDATLYPLADRIAARLHLEGVDEERFRTTFAHSPIFSLIHIRLIDIRCGHLKIDSQLSRLAWELKL